MITWGHQCSLAPFPFRLSPLRPKELSRFHAITVDCLPTAIVIDEMYQQTLEHRITSSTIPRSDAIYGVISRSLHSVTSSRRRRTGSGALVSSFRKMTLAAPSAPITAILLDGQANDRSAPATSSP